MPRTSFLRALTTIAEGRWRTIISLLMRGTVLEDLFHDIGQRRPKTAGRVRSRQGLAFVEPPRSIGAGPHEAVEQLLQVAPGVVRHLL